MGVEAERHLELTTPLGEDKLLIKQFHGTEQLSTCFEYVLSLYSEDHNLDADKLLGNHVSIRMRCGAQPERYIDGIACEFGHTGWTGRYATYHLTLRPWFWLLTNRTDSRVFQNRTSLEILREVVDGWQDADFEIDLRVQEPPSEREICVQYAESDFNFVTRLLEDDGLYFFFEHEKNKHKLVVADGKDAHKPAPSFEELGMRKWDSERTDAGSIHSWSSSVSVKPGAAALRDYYYEKPRADLDVNVEAPKTSHRRDKVAEIYEYPGHYREVEDGKKRLTRRIEELHTTFDVKDAVTDASGLNAGTLFKLTDHKRDAENQEYLVTSASIHADSGAFESGGGTPLEFQLDVQCIPSKTPFRPARRTPAPIIAGAQTATVVGHKEGEVTTNKFCRVKVHFPWNRARRGDKPAEPPDEKCSVWVRVMQSWTGTEWGSQFIPRVGQEVVVEFLEGNPDLPLITGCVYNERNKPPYSKPSQSGWKTRSLNQDSADHYNELRFDDDKGHEEVVLQAQRDMKTTVKNDETLRVGGKRAVTVVKGTHTIDVDESSMTVNVLKDTHTLNAKSAKEIALEEILMQIKEKNVDISLTSSGIRLTVGGNRIELNMMGIEITTGTSSITLGADGVSVKGTTIRLN